MDMVLCLKQGMRLLRGIVMGKKFYGPGSGCGFAHGVDRDLTYSYGYGYGSGRGLYLGFCYG